MKSSKIIILIISVVLIILTFVIVENERKSINERFGNNVGYVSSVESLNNHANSLKVEKRNNIIIVGTVAILILGVALIFFKNNDDKNDPFKNLDLLKSKAILNDEEFNSKKLEAQENEQQ